MTYKVVVIGDVNGRIKEVFGKLKALHSKQNFAFAIVAGSLFASTSAGSDESDLDLKQLLDGFIEVPLPTYFSVGNHSLPLLVLERLEANGGELCANLTALGRRVSIKTVEGLRIVALGGTFKDEEDVAMSPYEATYTATDAQILGKDLVEADILITNDWPLSIRTGSKAVYSGEGTLEAQSIADLCAAVKPRYHFSTSASFYEREPFFYTGPSPRKVTRFISLAPFGNASKQKWIYAFSIEPSAPPPIQLEPGYTACPFRTVYKRKPETQSNDGENFRYNTGSGVDRYSGDHGRHKRRKHQRPEPAPSECFFCLSNEACETHMISSIGSDCYLAVAKGPLSTSTTFPSLGFPGHMLIIPLQHSPTVNAISDQSARHSTLVELQKYRSAMHGMLEHKSKDEYGRATLGAVTWEVSRNRGVHVHWQFLPVPVDLVQRGLVEAAFDVEADNLRYPKFLKKSAQMESAEEGDYFKIMIWSEVLRMDMVLPIDASYRFDLQFGRRVLAKLLNLEDRVDWRACSQDQSEEEGDATKFKEAFKEFDFTLDE